MTKNQMDKLWREAVYKRANHRCEYCGTTANLNAHHIFSRSNYSTRWDVRNGVCVCVTHHVFGNESFHKAPAEMIGWIREERGEKWYADLRTRAKGALKMKAAIKLYADELKQILNG